MSLALRALSLAPLLAASSAYAQAPGEVAPTSSPYAPAPTSSPYAPPPPPPSYAPAPADPCGGPGAASVRARRWAIGLSLGRMGVAPEGAPEGTEARFGVTELAVRFRATRRIELELAMSGGRQIIEDGADGELAAGSVTLAVRYRFRPERRWNWFVMGGLGGTVIAPHQSTEAERDGATRPLGMVGIGVERRFRRLALQAELRGIGLGPREDSMGGDEPVVLDGGSAPPMPASLLPLAPIATAHAEQLGGAMMTIGASFYF